MSDTIAKHQITLIGAALQNAGRVVSADEISWIGYAGILFREYERICRALANTGIGGIFDEFVDPADAIEQMALHIKQLEGEKGKIWRRIECDYCARQWIAVFNDGTPFLECPSCHKMIAVRVGVLSDQRSAAPSGQEPR